VVPWREATARWICDSTWADGTPLEALPRRVWRRQLERARALGYEPLIGYEPEFYLLTADHEPLFEGYHIFNVTRNTYVPFIQELVEQLNAYGLEVITANCEYAGSQWELPCLPLRGMGGPDRCFSFKNAVKELAHQHGYTATFMSKPFADTRFRLCFVEFVGERDGHLSKYNSLPVRRNSDIIVVAIAP
jgi:glutamine synthetase